MLARKENKMQTLQVDSDKDLVRDVGTGAIINTNVIEYQNYLKRKTSAEERKQFIIQQQTELENIKNELAELKDLLTKMISAR